MTSKTKLNTNYACVETDLDLPRDVVGKKIKFCRGQTNKENEGIKLAVICNWNDRCGISTYTQYILNNLKAKVGQLKVFSEIREQKLNEVDTSGIEVDYCWKRGQSMLETVKRIVEWNPDVVMIQHEFGLFPKANYFLSMIENLAEFPIVTVMHSVYEHRDKSVCSTVLKNIIVHSQAGKDCLENTLGHKGKNIVVIPHGCVDFGHVEPHWNFFGTPYAIVQFGFGFSYKGVDVALEAIAILKKRSDKFKDIFYTYLCSENSSCKNINNSYYDGVKKKISELGLEDNATIQKGFFSDEELNSYLRTARLAIFPYVTDPNNLVFGVSGALRISMANNVPTIVSKSHMFSDMEGVLPRPLGSVELANEIEKVFTDEEYRNSILKKQRLYIEENSWESSGQKYCDFIKKIVEDKNRDVVWINQST
jgi:glycosyltransferase involved in cell wall biosynthesis